MIGSEGWLRKGWDTAKRWWRTLVAGDAGAKGGPRFAADDGKPWSTSVEIFAMPGHGRTSFLWANFYMLRQLSRLWSDYVCWPRDLPSAEALLEIHRHMAEGRLPKRSEGVERVARYSFFLQGVDAGGDHRLMMWDAQDPVFGGRSSHVVDWDAPGIWLLDLDGVSPVDRRFLDINLDRILRTRQNAEGTRRKTPYRLVVALTKADAQDCLPRELRQALVDDRLARALAVEPTGLSWGCDAIDLSQPPRPVAPCPDSDPVRAYYRSRLAIDDAVRGWLDAGSAGRALLRRAADLQVELRFCVVSATGSGFASGGQLGQSWSPRRILDPFFWALELVGDDQAAASWGGRPKTSRRRG